MKFPWNLTRLVLRNSVLNTHRSCAMSSIPSKLIHPPCQVGENVAEIDTPALVVDLAKLEKNLKKLPSILDKYPGVKARVHSKAHKTPALAKLQLQHGSSGVCCQILSEAEAMFEGGVTDILISNQVVGSHKVRRLCNLAKKAHISVCVDDVDNITEISQTAADCGSHLDLVVEVDVGQKRCGVESGAPAVALAQLIAQLPNVSFKGIQCYQGLNQHVRTAEGRKQNVDAVVVKVKETLQALSEAGIECPYVTGGGTGSFVYEAGSGVFTEVQPGSYVVMDADYGRNYVEDGSFFCDFEQSLYIISTVQSVNKVGNRAVVDCGLKGVSLDSGVPVLADYPEITFTNGGDEHGILNSSAEFKVGDKVWLIPGHCDPTINMYDWIIGMRDKKVECVWPVAGRGPGI